MILSRLKTFLKTLLLFSTKPLAALSLLGTAALVALVMAYIAQFVFHLQPCSLCLFQRGPFFFVICLSILAFALWKRKPALMLPLLTLQGLAYGGNALLAFYHTGVERHWWASALEGCNVPIMEGDIKQILQRISESAPVRCDSIPWADPIIGLSMANYNVAFCLILSVFAFYSVAKNWRTEN